MKNTIISMNYRFGVLALVIAMLTGPSCSKKFLDQVPYNSVPASGSITDEASMYTALLGLYSSLRATDFYGRTYAIKGDLMSDDCFLSTGNSGRYLAFNEYNLDKTSSYPSTVWQNAYAGIKNANQLINSGLDVTTDNISQMYAEAYALRGLILFDLVRNYSLPYAKDPNGPGVPIVLKFEQLAKPKRDSISKCYAQVIADLTKAYSMIKFDQGGAMKFIATGQTRTMNSSYITKYTIEGILARVYQHMGDWANAKASALDVVTNGGYHIMDSSAVVSYWAGAQPRTDKVETMFEVTSDANNSVADGTLANIYVPKPTGSYGDILATKDFYNSYAITDVRRKLYNPATRSQQLGTAYYITKYPIDVTNYDDVKIVRYSEVVLILAEAYYNSSDETNALKYLNLVAKNRDAAFAGYASTGTQVLEDILVEREKELAFEGYRFWDLYRLMRTFTKPQGQDENSIVNRTLQVVPGQTRSFIFPIPNDEIQQNPGIGQNPDY